MNCIIVDDDAFSMRIMTDFVRRTSYLTLVNTFNNAIDALEFIAFAGNKIQLIFLDIEMPEMSGMDFIKSIDQKETQVIIYSSQQKYALESYEYNVSDYLLKPVNYARFIKGVRRSLDNFALRSQTPTTPAATPEEDDKNVVLIKDSNGDMHRLRYSDIFFVEANENYITLYTPDAKLSIHNTLSKILKLLPPEYIVRTHRSYAIGKKYIVGADSNYIYIESSKMKKGIPIGKTFKPELKKLLTSLCIA